MASTSATVVVCSRNRQETCAEAVSAICASLSPDDELIVVDQSDDPDRLPGLVQRTAIDSRSRIIVGRRRGLSAGRNEGLAASRSELVLFTDDDCRPEPGWSVAWSRALTLWGEDVGIAFGKVRRPADQSGGFVAEFAPSEGVHGPELFARGAGRIGIGANMAIRRSAWERLGGFDEQLGAGAVFAAGEEIDMAYRIARAGWKIGHASPSVIHLGVRHSSAAMHLIRGYMNGTAAAYTKHARCGDWQALGLLLQDTRLQVAQVARQAIHRRRPLGLRTLGAHLKVVATAATWPLDRSERLYGVRV